MSETDYALEANQIQFPSRKEAEDESNDAPDIISQIPTFVRICCAVIIMILAIVVVYYNARIWKKEFNRLDEITIDTGTPTKFYLSDMTPVQYQGNRATCWAFSTIAALEQSYFANGYSKGYLDKDAKVLFSPQAFAIEVVKQCQNNYNVCKEYRKGAADNTTQVGDIAWLSYLPDLWTRVFPETVCPYQVNQTDEFECPTLEEHINASDNPIRFELNEAKAVYDATELKELLYRKKQAMPLTLGTSKIHWTIVCPEGGVTENNDSYSRMCMRVSELNLTKIPCNPGIAKVEDTDVCYRWVETEKPITLDGEMITNSIPHPTGDHCVTVVGWNDEMMTSPIPRRAPYQAELPGQRMSTGAYRKQNVQGLASSMGGFIVQNSWNVPSHTMQYWAGDTSTWDERWVCPNPTFPRNWLSCTSVAGVTHSHSVPRALRRAVANLGPLPTPIKNSRNQESPVANCAQNAEYMERLVQILHQPFEFECALHVNSTGQNTTYYGCDVTQRYFLDSMYPDENGLVNATFYAVPRTDNTEFQEVVFQHMTERELSNTLTPISRHLALDVLQNDADNCGYSFLPYSYLDVTSQYYRWYAMYYDVKWMSSSYLKKASSVSSFDYSLLKKAQTTRTRFDWEGPLPLANGSRTEL